MAKLLLGKEVTDALNASLQTRTAALREKGTVPTLGIIRVGANPSDLSYEKGAVKRAELVGVEAARGRFQGGCPGRHRSGQRRRFHPRRAHVPAPAQAPEGRPERDLQPA